MSGYFDDPCLLSVIVLSFLYLSLVSRAVRVSLHSLLPHVFLLNVGGFASGSCLVVTWWLLSFPHTSQLYVHWISQVGGVMVVT